MPAHNASATPIRPADLERHRDRANAFMVEAKWKPAAKAAAPSAEGGRWRPATDYSSTGIEKVNLMVLAKKVSADPLLLSEEAALVVRAWREGLAVAMHLAHAYGEVAGLERLIQLNRAGQLSGDQKAEFFDKHHASSAVALYGLGAYLHWFLSTHQGEAIASRQLTCPSLPEVDFANPLRALEGAIFYFGHFSEKDVPLQDGRDWFRLSLLYAENLLEEVRQRSGSLRFTEFFTDVHYRLEGSEFSVHGFAPPTDYQAVSVEFNRVSFGSIVGNRAAKHAARRLAERLLCYDRTAKKNPFMEIGGLPLVRMGYGKPGTGKSLQIAATATLLHEHCERLDLPFLFWPLPDNVVSTFQGGSAERMVDYMRRLQDDDKIIYAPIDDAENNFEDRTREGVSAGVREVIGVFLRYTEGAYAIRRGNAVVEFFTNLPEQLDKAVLSRVQDRFPILGAESREDFLDQDHLWWRRIREVDAKVIRQADPKDYAYLTAQAEVGSLTELEHTAPTLADPRLREVAAKVEKAHDASTHEFVARFYQGVLEVYPTFSSRDVRNIQQAINNRLTDFDLPGEWLESPELFFARDYATKLEMLRELMRGNMRGLSFAELRWNEVVNYCNNLATILNQDRERQIDRLVERLEHETEARARFAKKGTADERR